MCIVGTTVLLSLLLVASGKQNNVRVCSTIEIRNEASGFAQLRNCTVIEGHLAILLINYLPSNEDDSLKFPELVEITDYLFLYRVNGLRTLRYMFPNLHVIRGQNLFHSYALVAYEMMSLEEVGLVNLMTIVRGAVRLEKNPLLCYVNTIDWELIMKSPIEGNFIFENRVDEECVNVCPVQITPQGATDRCIVKDVAVYGSSTSVASTRRATCWNADDCQFGAMCDVRCPQMANKACYYAQLSAGDRELKCCNEQCLGGCFGPAASECYACVNVYHDGRCWSTCPEDTYKYLGRRCLTMSECTSLKKGQGAGSGANKAGNWKVLHDGNTRECVDICPPGYMDDYDNPNRCKRCEGRCPRECFHLVIDSIAAAQKLRGCTIIRGTLEIQVRGGGQVVRELEESLGSIEEVTEAVKIVHSYAVMSLNFLKNLRVIRGENLIKDSYSLFVLDNENLQDIWDYSTHPNLTIYKGRAFFHSNRKLCNNKINQLLDYTGLANSTVDGDIGSNGDQVACDITDLQLSVLGVTDSVAILLWNNFRTHDQRSILGWVLYTRIAPEQNLTLFSSRDACVADLWKPHELKYDDDSEADYIQEMIAGLQPFTQYAAYVQTYTISSARSGGISPIIYFTTNPSTPTMPRDIKILATRTTELTIAWTPPEKPNGNITHYHITCKPQKLRTEVFDQRNYCENKLLPFTPIVPKVEEEEEETNGTGQCAHCCACEPTEKEKLMQEQERRFQIEFENFLHNNVYVKRLEPPEVPDNGEGGEMGDYDDLAMNNMRRRRRRREAQLNTSSITIADDGHQLYNMSEDDNDTSPVPPAEYEKIMKTVVYGSLQANISGLDHFQDYIIEVVACQDSVDQIKNQTKLCSSAAIVMARTAADPTADNIDASSLSAVNGSEPGSVLLRWNEPPAPNGLIITYEVEIEYAGGQGKQRHCLRYTEYNESHGYIAKSLPAGYHSYRVRASSLGGVGAWTLYKQLLVVADKDDGRIPVGLIVSIVVMATIVMLAVVAMSVWWITKKRFDQMDITAGYASINPDYFNTDAVQKIYVADEWEIPRDKVKLLKELGQGSFGMVYEGIAYETVLHGENECVSVAVKTVNEKASARDRMEFLNEASVMKDFKCHHVVRLWGVVSKSQPTLVIMELMSGGDLKNYLRRHRPDSEDFVGEPPPQLSDILQMAAEIADGMAYLAAKKYVHRDLAARNCMVSGEGIVKIGDFGMTRDVYETDYYRKGGKGLLPIRWMAPESLNDGRFTSQSDVWAMGVVLWEMVTLAAQPYLGLSNEEVLSYVCRGERMDKPEGCPNQLYELMLMCWRQQPKDRPTFCEIIEILVPYLQPDFRDVSFFFSRENQELMAVSRHNQASTITLDFSSLCPRTDVISGNDWPDHDAHSPDVHTPLLVVANRLGSSSLPDLDQDSDDLDSESPASTPPQQQSWFNHPLSNDADNCERVELRPTQRTALMNGGHDRAKERVGGGGDVAVEVLPTEGSKGSSKSGDSSRGRNGFANGHLPYAYDSHNTART